MAPAQRHVSEPVKELSDALRGKHGVDYSQAKLEMGHEAVWAEYCRSKDLLKYLKEHPEKMSGLVKQAGAGREVEDVARDTIMLLLKNKLLLPCQRKFKKAKPGKKKLVKWPRTLEPAPEIDFASELFLAWSYERPTTMAFYLGAAAVAVGVLMVTLFPLAPVSVRLVVLYFLMAVLSSLLGVVALRSVVWVVVWLASGYNLWILPNLLSDEIPITKIWAPLLSFEKPSAGKKTLVLRFLVLFLIGGLGYGLYMTGPAPDTLKASVKDAHDSMLQYFDLMGGNRGGLGDKATTNGTAWGATMTEEDVQQEQKQQQSQTAGEQERDDSEQKTEVDSGHTEGSSKRGAQEEL